MSRIATPDQLRAARRVRSLLATYERERDLLTIGAYETGTDARIDEAAAKIDDIRAFLEQPPDECEPFATTRAKLDGLATAYERAPADAYDDFDDGFGEE